MSDITPSSFLSEDEQVAVLDDLKFQIASARAAGAKHCARFIDQLSRTGDDCRRSEGVSPQD